MSLSDRMTAIAWRPHVPRRTVRLRLTLLYGALFLVAGGALLGITYVLVRHTTSSRTGVTVMTQGFSPAQANAGSSQTRAGAGVSRQSRIVNMVTVQLHAGILRQMLIDSIIALGIMVVISVALGWLVAGRVLRPLRAMTATTRQISEENLHERLALQGPNDEVKDLGDTIDGLLGRLEAAFQAQRRFVANASHELRTPLARQRTLIQVALSDPDATPGSLRAAHERVLVAGREQERLIEALLALTRGQAGFERRELIDLAQLTETVLLKRQPEATLGSVDVHESLSPTPIVGDPRLVERLVGNLIDNALYYNVSGGRVEVVTEEQDGGSVLSVANTGPMISASEIDRLVQPFQRLETERTAHHEGVGLGLSIVQAIAKAHDATLVIDPRPEGGLRVEVRFPTTPSAN
jgi:signal transduction histidine kinase